MPGASGEPPPRVYRERAGQAGTSRSAPAAGACPTPCPAPGPAALLPPRWHRRCRPGGDRRGAGTPPVPCEDVPAPSLTCPPPPPLPVPPGTMGGCFSKPKPVEVKIEVVIPEKERSKEEMSPNGKASPLIYKVNGTARHYHLEEHPIASNPYHNPKDVVEASVCHVKDLENGQMREVDLGCGKALLIKESGEFHAVGHKCPHYGAPLVKGVLSKGRVRCPWHGACYQYWHR
ncbi:apoptosis-inducing factor 3-like [Anomalospiza imberbis]|uniref:apoptosis-inducing factor 3-like n=1 Tax=Anomalospiza imberbis TaxID=187417 RepID=UPI00358FE087